VECHHSRASCHQTKIRSLNAPLQWTPKVPTPTLTLISLSTTKDEYGVPSFTKLKRSTWRGSAWCPAASKTLLSKHLHKIVWINTNYNGDQHLSVLCLTHTHANQLLVFHPCWRCSPAFQPHSVRYSAARTQLDDFAGRLYHSQKTEHNIVQLIIPLGVWFLFTDGNIIPFTRSKSGLIFSC
jgi:hypothetical protein